MLQTHLSQSRGVIHLVPLLLIAFLTVAVAVSVSAVRTPVRLRSKAQSNPCLAGICVGSNWPGAPNGDCQNAGGTFITTCCNPNDSGSSTWQPGGYCSNICGGECKYDAGSGNWQSASCNPPKPLTPISVSLAGFSANEPVLAQVVTNKCEAFSLGQQPSDGGGNVAFIINPQSLWNSMVLVVDAKGRTSGRELTKNVVYTPLCSTGSPLPACSSLPPFSAIPASALTPVAPPQPPQAQAPSGPSGGGGGKPPSQSSESQPSKPSAPTGGYVPSYVNQPAYGTGSKELQQLQSQAYIPSTIQNPGYGAGFGNVALENMTPSGRLGNLKDNIGSDLAARDPGAIPWEVTHYSGGAGRLAQDVVETVASGVSNTFEGGGVAKAMNDATNAAIDWYQGLFGR